MDDNEGRCTVKIVTDATALSRPSFIIKDAGRYYVSLAVWEYDPNAPHLTPEQKRDIDDLIQIFEHSRREGRVCEAAELISYRPICHAATRPGPPGGGSGQG